MSEQKEPIKFMTPTEGDVKQWWQWVSSIPEINQNGQKHPFLQGGETNQKQPKNFICLACLGRRGGSDNRKITVSPGKDILVPVFVASYSEIELPGESLSILLDRCIQETQKGKDGKNVEFSVDNIVVDPYFMATQTPFPLQHPNMCVSKLPKDKKEGTYQTMSAGYWCKLSLPEQKQPYVIKFGGETNIEVGENAGIFRTNVTYEVTIA
jgi:hypothetical protein